MKSFVIDVHAHLGVSRGFRPYYDTIDKFVSLMDMTGTEMALIVHMALLEAQFELGYREAKDALRRYPGRFGAYAVFDPNWPDLTLRLLQEHLALPGFVGVKIHPALHTTDPGDPRYQDFWALANEEKMIVLTHTWYHDPANRAQDCASPDRLARILQDHPNLSLILGHCGGNESGQRLALDLLRHYPNCWADLSGDHFPPNRLEWLAAQVGTDRLLFGSDALWIEPRYVLGSVLKSGLDASSRLDIMRNNAQKLFGSRLIDGCEVQDPLERVGQDD